MAPSSPALNCSAPDPTPFWVRILRRLWPWQHHAVNDLPSWARDAIYMDCIVELSFVDRIRILFSGRLRVRVCTLTETPPGRIEASAIAHPIGPRWLD